MAQAAGGVRRWFGSILLFGTACVADGERGSRPTSSTLGPTTMIGNAGGVIRYDALTVTIPPGALTHPVAFSARAIQPLEVLGAEGPWFEVEPSGTTFARPATALKRSPWRTSFAQSLSSWTWACRG